MEFECHYHRFANLVVTNEPEYISDFNQIINTIRSITDEDLISKYLNIQQRRANIKSLSEPINLLLKERLTVLGWSDESPIFREAPYNQRKNSDWRLDFAKNNISVEVAFNHGEATAHNIMKPVLASELNHVQKAIQTHLGIIITATSDFKSKGGFDGAIGPYEKYVSYLKPYSTIITVPLVIIGLKSPESFQIINRDLVYY